MDDTGEVGCEYDLFGQVVQKKKTRQRMKEVLPSETASYKAEDISPEKLASGMLKLAILDLQGLGLDVEDDCEAATDLYGQEAVQSASVEAIRMDALCWIFGIADQPVLSFEHCCELTDCCPEAMRRKVARVQRDEIKALIRRLTFIFTDREYQDALDKVDGYVCVY